MMKNTGLLLVAATGMFPVGSGLDFGPGKGAPGEEDTGGGEAECPLVIMVEEKLRCLSDWVKGSEQESVEKVDRCWSYCRCRSREFWSKPTLLECCGDDGVRVGAGLDEVPNWCRRRTLPW